MRNNQRPPQLFTDWQILQLKRTYSNALRTLNSQVFRELQRILSNGLRGHIKTGQRWSRQNRPTEVAGD